MADYMDFIYMSFEILIAFTCCLGNALVIWAVKLNHSLREPTFCFIVSLAVADFLVGAVAIPSAIFVNSEVETSFHGCLFICCIVMILTESSILSLLAIAVDRYLRIKMPFRYRRIAAQKQSWLGVAVCWLISGILGLVPIFGWHNKGSMNSTGNSAIINCTFTSVMCMSYMVYFNFLGCVLIPLLVMALLLYMQIFQMLKKQLNGKSNSSEFSMYYQKERKLTHSLALVLLLFAMCWLPLHTLNCIFFFRPQKIVSDTVFHVGILLSHLNSVINPIIYPFRIKKIQQAYQEIWTKYFLPQEKRYFSSSQSAENNGSSNRNSTIRFDKVVQMKCDKSRKGPHEGDNTL